MSAKPSLSEKTAGTGRRSAPAVSYLGIERQGRFFSIGVVIEPEEDTATETIWVRVGKRRHVLETHRHRRVAKFQTGTGWKLLTVCRKTRAGDIQVLKRKLCFVSASSSAPRREGKKTRWGILAPPHALFLARLLAGRLRHHGFPVEVLTPPLQGGRFPLDAYVVIQPQLFERLPPGEKRICFQLEQSGGHRRIAPAHLHLLESSRAVIDHALANIASLADESIAYPNVHYLPVGNLATAPSAPPAGEEKTHDILMHGDCLGSPRRRAMLAELEKHFLVRTGHDLSGPALADAIRKARLVVNLREHDHSLPDTLRIQEALALGVPVVAEASRDQNDNPELARVATFFTPSSIEDMIATVRQVLDHPPSAREMDDARRESAARFDFLFDRILVALDYLPASHAGHMPLPLPPSADRILLSLPETIHRRRSFLADAPAGFTIFDGVRRHPGWIGCGLSYQTLARHALRSGLNTLAIVEDDAVLPPDFEGRLVQATRYLESLKNEWDVFCGLIPSLHAGVRIHGVEQVDGVLYVRMDRMTGMVCNLYNRGALEHLIRWNPHDIDVTANTIDRFLETRENLKVVTTIPFLAGHREELRSTLWGFDNTRYRGMIGETEDRLRKLAEDFLAANRQPPRESASNARPARPKVLFVSPVFPDPEGGGTPRRAHAVIEALAREHEVTLLVISPPGQNDSAPPRPPDACAALLHLPDHAGDDRRLRLRRFLALRHPRLFTQLFRHPSDWRDPTARRLHLAVELCRGCSFDVIHAFRMLIVPYALAIHRAGDRRASLHLDTDDVESLTHRRFAERYLENGSPEKARAERILARAYARAESDFFPKFDRLYVCSRTDAHRIAPLHDVVRVLPNTATVPPDQPPPPPPGGPFRLLFIGSLSYYPNLDALYWFCRDTLPGLREGGRCELMVAGHLPDPELVRFLHAQPGVVFLGSVARARSAYEPAHALVVPLRVGGGTRLKILEAFAQGRPVVSTALGMEGIDAIPGEHYLSAETPEAFVRAIRRLSDDPGLHARLAREAFGFVTANHSVDALLQPLSGTSTGPGTTSPGSPFKRICRATR